MLTWQLKLIIEVNNFKNIILWFSPSFLRLFKHVLYNYSSSFVDFSDHLRKCIIMNIKLTKLKEFHFVSFFFFFFFFFFFLTKLQNLLFEMIRLDCPINLFCALFPIILLIKTHQARDKSNVTDLINSLKDSLCLNIQNYFLSI